MKTVYLIACLLVSIYCSGQDISAKLTRAMTELENDKQFAHAISSMYVVESKTGKAVFAKNEQVGLAPASCQKVVTSAAAFELLGKNFRYKTFIGKDASTSVGAGCLFVIGDGDPTLGSWRWRQTSDTAIFSRILQVLKKQQLTIFNDNLVIEDLEYGISPVPDGWVWQDIGNYYGAGCYGFNWHENQFDLGLQPGKKEGDLTTVSFARPMLFDVDVTNNIHTGKAGSGDNGYIYSSPYSKTIVTQGTVPLQKDPFVISGSLPSPSKVFKDDLFMYLDKHGIAIKGVSFSSAELWMRGTSVHKATAMIDSIVSPTLDSINYWFLKKSVNLFGEAFVKRIAYEKTGTGSTDSGVAVIKNFWNKNGIDKGALNIIDGSGLSPANRVSTHALVKVMQYAREQSWFSSFYYALPEMNGIKMKDGYIGGVRSYTGFVKSKSGTEYTFSFIVNNFEGNPGTVREKIWKVLDLLK